MTRYPLDHLDDWLPESVRAVVERDTPIPTVAQRAAGIARDDASFVRADIGQISGLDAELEVLYGPPVGLEELRVAVAELWTKSSAPSTLRLASVRVKPLRSTETPDELKSSTNSSGAITLTVL